jgi:hypothetical protein
VPVRQGGVWVCERDGRALHLRRILRLQA